MAHFYQLSVPGTDWDRPPFTPSSGHRKHQRREDATAQQAATSTNVPQSYIWKTSKHRLK